jgi:hypothetical protein
MTSEFERDDHWQLRIAIKFLDPFYRSRGWQIIRYPGDHPMQRLHVDVTLQREDRESHHIDEKIIRGRHDRQKAEKISLETWSCSVAGAERPGWISPQSPNKATILLVCFADDDGFDQEAWTRVRTLDCVWIPLEALRVWFAQQDHGQWELQDNMQSNHSLSRKVWIRDIFAAIQGCARFEVIAPPSQPAAPIRPPAAQEESWRRRAASFVGASLAALQAELRRTEGKEGLPLWYRAGLWRSLDRLVAAAAPPAMAPLSELPTGVAGRPVEHWCKVCGVEAAWGYGVHLLAGEMGEWYCSLHRPDRPPEDDRRAFEDWTADREREQW